MSAPDYHPGPAFDVLGKLRAAEAEVSRLRVVVAQVEALADTWGDYASSHNLSCDEFGAGYATGYDAARDSLVDDLLAALRGDA